MRVPSSGIELASLLWRQSSHITYGWPSAGCQFATTEFCRPQFLDRRCNSSSKGRHRRLQWVGGTVPHSCHTFALLGKNWLISQSHYHNPDLCTRIIYVGMIVRISILSRWCFGGGYPSGPVVAPYGAPHLFLQNTEAMIVPIFSGIMVSGNDNKLVREASTNQK